METDYDAVDEEDWQAQSQRADFLGMGADFGADYQGLEYYWNQYQGVVPVLGTKPSSEVVGVECHQNGAIGPLGDNKGRAICGHLGSKMGRKTGEKLGRCHH